MNKHTPGPWNVHALSNGHDGVVDGNGCDIASVWNAEVDIQGANARLIAQAPAMRDFIIDLEAFWPEKVVKAHPDVKMLLARAHAILCAVEGEK